MGVPVPDPGELAKLDPEVRVQVEVALAELAEHIRANPLANWLPYAGAQREYLGVGRVSLGTKLLAGGNRAGKTEVGVVDDLLQCVDRECLPDALKVFKHWEPPFRCRVVSPSYTQQHGVLLDKFRKLCPPGQLKGGSWQKGYAKNERMLMFANGSWVQFLTAEQDVDVHSGLDLDRVHFDEEPTPPEKGRQLWQENRMRLIDRGGQMVFTMTPLLGLTFTHDEIYDRRHDPAARVVVVQASMDDNPFLGVDERKAALEGFTDDEVKARRDGMFVHFAGRVFDEFDDHVHVLKTPPSRQHVRGLTVVEGIDPGVRRTGVVWVGFDRDGSALVFDELYMPDATVDRVADRIRDIRGKWGITPLFSVIDPSARNRSLTDAEHVEGEYMRHGIYTVHGQNDVEAGLLMWKRRLQADPPAFLLSPELRVLPWEMGRYRIDERADGRFAVVKRDDHVIDPTRYVLMSMPWEGSYGVPDVRRRHGWTPGVQAPPGLAHGGPVVDEGYGPLGAFS